MIEQSVQWHSFGCIKNMFQRTIASSLLLLAVIGQVWSQQILTGSIFDSETEESLPFTSVYLNNTTIGTTSDQSGVFSLNIPEGEHEVIIQHIGYQTLHFKIKTNEIAPQYRIILSPESQELDAVKIEGERDAIWYENLKTFKRHFLGTSKNAGECIIENEKSLIIDFNHQTGLLQVSAREPIKIFNPNLGYAIHYDLVEFTFNTREGRVFFAGYPFFKEIEMGRLKKRKTDKARKRAYQGSVQHLLSSLVNNCLDSSGFEVRRLHRIPNPERPDEAFIKEALNIYMGSDDPVVKDSLRDNFISKRRLPKMVDYLEKQKLTESEIITKNETGYIIHTESFLHIIYKKEDEEWNYVHEAGRAKRLPQTSIIQIINHKEHLDVNGNITDPANIYFEGYMGWEKIGDMLPLNYP